LFQDIHIALAVVVVVVVVVVEQMEGMMNDLAIGAETSRNFETFCKENPDKTGLGKVEFAVQILTTGHWPQYKTFHEINLPPIMQRCTQAFKEYYDAKTNYRRLTWTHSLGGATVKGTFNKKSYELQVTTLQAVIMLAFNADTVSGASGGPISFNNLLETYNIPEDVLKKVLHSLSCGKYKVLKKISESVDDKGDKGDKGGIKVTDSFTFNDQFT
jgi:cullin 1